VLAKAVVTFTKCGRIPMVLSDERPRSPALALTTESATHAWLVALYWGVVPRLIPMMGLLSKLVSVAEQSLIETGLAHSGDVVVYVFGNETSPDAANSVKVA